MARVTEVTSVGCFGKMSIRVRLCTHSFSSVSFINHWHTNNEERDESCGFASRFANKSSWFRMKGDRLGRWGEEEGDEETRKQTGAIIRRGMWSSGGGSKGGGVWMKQRGERWKPQIKWKTSVITNESTQHWQFSEINNCPLELSFVLLGFRHWSGFGNGFVSHPVYQYSTALTNWSMDFTRPQKMCCCICCQDVSSSSQKTVRLELHWSDLFVQHSSPNGLLTPSEQLKFVFVLLKNSPNHFLWHAILSIWEWLQPSENSVCIKCI